MLEVIMVSPNIVENIYATDYQAMAFDNSAFFWRQLSVDVTKKFAKEEHFFENHARKNNLINSLPRLKSTKLLR